VVARDEEALISLRDRLKGAGSNVAVCRADVSDLSDVEHVAGVAFEMFGGFDSWINNAGVGTYGTLEQVPLSDHRRVFDVNYFGMLHGSLVAARHLRQRSGGAIINIGSILSDRAIVQQGPYSASKHAVEAMTETLRMEVERDGISVTLIKPGAVGTPFAEHARNFMDQAPRLPPPRYVPEVVANAVLFACAHQRRTIYAGGGGLVASIISRIAPRLTDMVMEVTGKTLQQKAGHPGDSARRDNVYDSRPNARRGSQRLHPRGHSVLVQMQKLPAPVLVLSPLGVGTAIVLRGHALSARP
jgi:NAD(P)-dependent dehydrogenase (short-subunit alcohol dehydrogenase family)